MRMKQMVEVKNAWKNEGNLMNDRSAKKKLYIFIYEWQMVHLPQIKMYKKKMGVWWMVHLPKRKDVYERIPTVHLPEKKKMGVWYKKMDRWIVPKRKDSYERMGTVHLLKKKDRGLMNGTSA